MSMTVADLPTAAPSITGAEPTPGAALRVEVWSDVVCPWCYVGLAQLEAALADFDHADQVQVVLRSYQLDPSAPVHDDVPLVTRLARKYATSEDQIRSQQERLRQAGAELGIDFQFDRTARGNTLDAHRLLHLAAEHGLQAALKHRLLQAYFTEGQDVGEHDVPRLAATTVGLDPAEVDNVLAGDRYLDEVATDVDTARDLDITGVPFFLVDGRLGIPGAQRPELLLRVLQRAWRDREDAQDLGAAIDGDATCGPDGCAVG